ncbi:conserved protein of unknown function [uncultured Sphingopyxis sp.]|uniref:Alpha/beta hydrolase n=1 Tax=uncultured Sphingopyxis sp. TaxID=310581 RepID=A0A1Y5PP68_9SPHN|nr:alpha/beta hydrolase [uncultured Sphingopyxis sp.]SBV31798.1 conserved protein of unknown function [uncultured Sphingopyxis sp.]
MPRRTIVEIDIPAVGMSETQSGITRMKPRILGALVEPDAPTGVAALIAHPTNNFLGHPLLSPLAERGIAALGLNTRFMNNDATLIMEKAIQDIGAGVRWLRERGYEQVHLVGFSGGAALACFYQAQAEKLTIVETPAGDAVSLSAGDLPPADSLSLIAAHLGRSRLLQDWIDPSLTDESDAASRDPSLDMYDAVNGPPYSDEFLERYRSAQSARRDRIEAWAKARLGLLRINNPSADEAFVVHRTFADPRFMDLSLDPNGRHAGGIWGNARDVNYAANAIGRYTSLTAFLSQWAGCSNADGPTNVMRTSIPVQYIELGGDASTFPSTTRIWREAIESRGNATSSFHAIDDADHYLKRPEHLREAADMLAAAFSA